MTLIFYALWIFTSAVIIMNLFIGVLIDNFRRMKVRPRPAA